MAVGIGSDSQEELGPVSEINVTPFVDVVLVLLVIFMVTAPALLKDRLGIQLPKTQTSDGKAPESLGIAVTRQGQILVAGVPMSDGEIQAAVTKALSAAPGLQGLISADQDARHGDVVRAIDLIKGAGLARFALQIVREEKR
jgi:biopolymer transport protein ExbD